MILNSKAISPIISTTLLLSISVIIAVGVYQFSQDYSQNTEEIAMDNAIIDGLNTRVIDTNQDRSYIQTPYSNLNISRVVLDGNECTNNSGVATSQTLEINLSSCLGSVNSSRPILTIETNEGIIQLDLSRRDLTVTSQTIISTRLCYQTIANGSKPRDTLGCSFDFSGTYALDGNFTSIANLYDGNRSTAIGINFTGSGTHNIYINYSKPTGALSSSFVEASFYEDSSIPSGPWPENISIPSGCWNQDSLTFREQIVDPGSSYASDSFHCYNGTSWVFLGAGFRADSFYGASMYWNISE